MEVNRRWRRGSQRIINLPLRSSAPSAVEKSEMNRRMILPLLLLLAIAAAAQSQNTTGSPNYPQPVEGDFTILDFKFDSGETLPELKLHYRTIGELKRDSSGVAQNAVLILHGTGGSGAGFLSNQF